MHITLKFVGEVSEGTVARIREGLTDLRVGGPIGIRFREIGFFPNAKHPRVVWGGIEAPRTLAELASEIERRLEPLGIPRETRPFKPHLTLARFKSEDGLPKLHEALQKLGPFDFGAMSARSFCLYQSVLRPSGAVYTRLAEFPFAEGGA